MSISDNVPCIRLPLPAKAGAPYKDVKKGVIYVEVDPEKIGPHVISEFWVRVEGKISVNWQRYHGVEAASGKLDVDDLLAVHAEAMEQCETALEAMGPVGQLLKEKLLPLLSIEKVVRALAAFRVSEATDLVRDGGYQVLGALGEIASVMVTKEKADHAWQTLSAMEEGKDGFYQSTYQDWAAAALDLNIAVKKVQEFETELRAKLEEAEQAAAHWSNKLDPEGNASLKDAYLFLEGKDIDDGFAARACIYQRKEVLTRAEMDDVQFARANYDECSALLEKERQAWAPLKAAFLQFVLERNAAVAGLVEQLDSATQRLHAGERHRDERGFVVPYEAPEQWRFINKADYEQALQALREPLLAPRRTQNRLNQLLSSLQQQASREPIHQASIHRMLREAEGALIHLEKMEVADDTRTAPDQVGEAHETEAVSNVVSLKVDMSANEAEKLEVAHPRESDIPVTLASASTPEISGLAGADEGEVGEVAAISLVEASNEEARPAPTYSIERREEIYEILIAVGYFVTHSDDLRHAKTPHGLFQISVELGLVDPQEDGLYWKELRERFDRETGESTIKRVLKDVQREKAKRWLSYKMTGNRYYLLKIAKWSSVQALELAQKYKLTQERVQQAKIAHRTKSREKFDERRKTGSDS